ncbi:hypothetical protein R1flu_006385 [Riccia fluitans]|uniref:Transmembrane protein n=1 Tax=Riccia fluitans TaxID=41844 RepID=A0ABD1YVV9_9MARC
MNGSLVKYPGPQLQCSISQFSRPRRFWAARAESWPRYLKREFQGFYLNTHFGGTLVATRLSHSGSSKRGRASRRDDGSGSSERENADNSNNEAGEGSSSNNNREDLGDVSEKNLLAEKAAQRQASKVASGFWGRFWGKVREEIDEGNESETTNDDNDEEDSERQQEEEEAVFELTEEEMVSPSEGVQEARRSERGFWRRWWNQDAETPGGDPQTARDDELLLLDLENLQFRWKELLEPTPENLLALGLTALLGFAGLQIIWQMAVVAVAITLSALKYTILAAIIVGLLIFLL